MSKALKITVYSLLIATSISLSACQNVKTNSKVIAGAFNTSTHFQRFMMDKYAPENIHVQNNIQYQENPVLNFDLYQPENIEILGKRPVIVWVHGGGWVSGAKDNARGYYKLLAAQGYNVISIDYQLAPEVVYPTQLHQINQALQYITRHAEQYNLDAQSIFLAGDSAGANMVSHYAALLTNPVFARSLDFVPLITAKQLKGLILHCGIYDMASFITTAPDEISIIEWGVNNMVQAYTGNQKDNLEFLKQISPIQHITSDYPPVFISGGNKDFLTKTQSAPFVDALKKNNVSVVPVFYPDSKEWLIHEYQFFLGKDASQNTFNLTLDFLKEKSS
nr:alpha/beta hydrolase [Acinetobacter sp. Marseille-Q1620]